MVLARGNIKNYELRVSSYEFGEGKVAQINRVKNSNISDKTDKSDRRKRILTANFRECTRIRERGI